MLMAPPLSELRQAFRRLRPTLLWIAFSIAFSFYLRFVGRVNQVLGALGGGLTLLIWIYLLSVAMLLGSELNSVGARQPDRMERAVGTEEHARTVQLTHP